MRGRLVLIPEKASIAREILLRAYEGASTRDLQRWLLTQGVVSPSGKKQWALSTILRLLRNPTYKGLAPYGQTRRVTDQSRLERGSKVHFYYAPRPQSEWSYIPCPALVDEAIFDRVQKRLDTARQDEDGNPQRRSLLTGLVLCPRCGVKMTTSARAHASPRRRGRPRKDAPQPKPGPEKEQVYRYYACHTSKHRTEAEAGTQAAKRCPQKSILAARLESQVLEALQKIGMDRQMFARLIAAQQNHLRGDVSESEIQKVVDNINALEKCEAIAIEAQITAIEKGISVAAYDRLLQKIAGERETLEQRLQDMEPLRSRSSPHAEPAHRLQAALEQFLQLVDSCGMADNAKADNAKADNAKGEAAVDSGKTKMLSTKLKTIVESIILRPNNDIEITFRV